MIFENNGGGCEHLNSVFVMKGIIADVYVCNDCEGIILVKK